MIIYFILLYLFKNETPTQLKSQQIRKLWQRRPQGHPIGAKAADAVFSEEEHNANAKRYEICKRVADRELLHQPDVHHRKCSKIHNAQNRVSFKSK